jgi:6-phosphogluconolactonase
MVAREAAAFVAAEARTAIAVCGRFVMAASGGNTPWLMLRALAEEEVPWDGLHLVQVDERVAPVGHSDRNLIHLHETLLKYAPLSLEQVHAMPVDSPDLDSSCAASQKQSNHLRLPCN